MSAETAANAPFYLNWEFWTAVVAFAALILSQLPPLYPLFRRGRLTAETYDRLLITHTLGNPNAQLHLIVINHGGRPVRVRRITLTARRDDDPPFTLTALNYYQSMGDRSAVLLTPFTVGPKQEWAHIVGFVAQFSRQDDQRFRQIQSAIRTDIQAKKSLSENADAVVEADAATVNPALAFFQQKFKWEPGEYAVTINFMTEPTDAALEKRYRITLFESDTADLRRITAEYRYGLGVYYFNMERHPGVFPPITEV